MLNKLEIRNSQGQLLTLEFSDVSGGIVLRDIKGLDPVKATLASSGFAQIKGKQFHARHTEERNIIVELGIEPDYAISSVESVRDKLYDYFLPDDGHVDLTFYRSGGLVVNIQGEVESCEAPLFVQEPQMDVSILCFQPDFVNLTPVNISGSTTSGSTETSVVYPGNVSTGVVLTLNVDRTLSEFTFYHQAPGGTTQSLDFAASLVSGDVVTISTVPGNKSATLTRTGVASSLLYAISPQSTYHQLKKGTNHIRVYAEGAAIPYTIQYLERYGAL